MTWHTAAYSSSVALTSTNQKVNAVPDSILRIGGSNGFVPNDPLMLIAASAGGVGMANPKLTAPILAQFNPLQIFPFQTAAAISSGLNVARYPFRPFQFRALEEITAFSDNSNAGAQQETITVHLSNGIDAIPPGVLLTVGFTSTTTAVGFAWTAATYTFNQPLPAGQYAMVASILASTTAIAHRWTFFGQFYRPGMPSTTALSNPIFTPVADLSMGTMGSFMNTSPPNLEVLAGAADASHAGFMYLIKVG